MNAISVVQKAVSSKTNLDILKGILIDVNSDSIKLTGYDLNLAIEISIEAQVEEQGSVVLDARLLGEIVRKLPDATIDFNFKDNFIEIDCIHSNFKLMAFNSDEYPKLPLIENSRHISFDQDIFKNLIKQTLFSVSNDETRPILTGALLEIDSNIATMVAIDGYRMALKHASVNSEDSSKTVIPGKTLSELLKILSSSQEETIDIEITEKYIAFKIERIRIISKILEGEFIKYNQIIPTDFNTRVHVNTQQLNQAIERASLMARETKSATIKMSFKDQFMEITSISEIGSVNEKVNIRFEGDKFDIGFNPKYLSEALRVMESEDVLLELSSSLSPCIIRPVDNDQYTYLVLPVRMSN
jgi:DNA polymerase-3 subunit beta